MAHLTPEDGTAHLFRREALDHHEGINRELGSPLLLPPGWTAWAYRLLVVIALAGAMFLGAFRTYDYAQGPAVVCLGGRIDVTADTSGVVSTIEVTAGQMVQPGQLLVHLDDRKETSELERLSQEFDVQLATHLKDLSDPDARQGLIQVRSQTQLAQARLESRLIRSGYMGLVDDIYLRPGQAVEPGERLLSLQNGDGPNYVKVLLPGHYRPLLRAGMPLRLELSGYRDAYQSLTIDSVGESLIGTREAQQFLGPGISESLSLAGPVVLARAALPSARFLADGRSHDLHQGMIGQAAVTIRSRPLLLKLIPGLETLLAGRST